MVWMAGVPVANKSIVHEAAQINLAIELIGLGARIAVLESETNLSRERLINLYKEIKHVSPPKGLLPFSVDWFMTWKCNIHASMFYNTYRFMVTHGRCTRINALVKSYRIYLEQVAQQGGEVVLDFMRAWTLVRYFDSDMLHQRTCTRCTGLFVSHAYDSARGYVCVLCRPPSRAGKTSKAVLESAANAANDGSFVCPPAGASSKSLADVMRIAFA